VEKDDLHKLLKYAVIKSASDIHLSAGMPPVVRINGSIHRLNLPAIKMEELSALIDTILTGEQADAFTRNKELDFAYVIEGISRFRTNAYQQMHGPALAFRTIPERVQSLEELQCPAGVIALAKERKGIVLVTGPTGSGKTTTLAAMLDLINRERNDHILTIEDPIEYVHASQKCMVNQRELGTHTNSFENALRAALREDPDVILVGEMRDLSTISLALTAAETGHLVFATLHTMGAAETINRIVDVFPAGEQGQVRSMFSNALTGVVSQRLLPTSDGRSRVAVHEILIANSAIRNLIREDKTHQLLSVMQTSASTGMQTIDTALLNAVKQGRITREMAATQAHDKRAILNSGL